MVIRLLDAPGACPCFGGAAGVERVVGVQRRRLVVDGDGFIDPGVLVQNMARGGEEEHLSD